MKYLKYFESDENDAGFIIELQDFCEGYLAYLLDNDEIYLDVTSNSAKGDGFIEIFGINEMSLNWNNIKDHIIPFLQLLSSNYNIVSDNWGDKDADVVNNIFYVLSDRRYAGYTLDEIVVKDIGWFTSIHMVVKNKITK
jgi:hypothetical protein